MMKILEFNKSQKNLVQRYVNHFTGGIPALFDFGFEPVRPAGKSPGKPSAPGKINQLKIRRTRRTKAYLLLGDGAFGGVVLQGLMVLRGGQYLFDAIQAGNLHASDSFIPGHEDALFRLFKSKRFRRKSREDKSELNSNA